MEFVMSEAQRYELVEARLQSYQNQMVALSEALGALRSLADTIISELAQDAAGIRSNDPAQQTSSLSTVVAKATDCSQTAVCEAFGIGDAIMEPAAAAVVDAAMDASVDTCAASALPGENSGTSLDSADHVTCEAFAPFTVEEPVGVDAVSDAAPANGPAIALVTQAAVGAELVAAAAAGTPAVEGGAKIIDLAASRSNANRPSSARRRHGVGIAASLLLVATSGAAIHGIANTGIGQRLIELGTCDAEMLSAHRDCALLAWLLL